MSWFKSIKEKLIKTSNAISNGISKVFNGSRKIDTETLQELEEMLLLTDMGPEVAFELVEKLKKTKFNHVLTELDIQEFLRNEITDILIKAEKKFEIETNKTHVIMLCGVNGNGKTTTAGKLATQFKTQGMSVMFGACDTFRAAAVEQLQEWGKRVECDVIVGETNEDPASVGYKAFSKAIETKTDILILDTAGRLQNKTDLMSELQKCVRVLKKLDSTAPHEIMMIVDSTTGQNAYNQIVTFNSIIPISGLIFTKLDSSAKGGVIIGAAKKYDIPIYFIGIGEQVNDLKVFQAKEFAESIL